MLGYFLAPTVLFWAVPRCPVLLVVLVVFEILLGITCNVMGYRMEW